MLLQAELVTLERVSRENFYRLSLEVALDALRRLGPCAQHRLTFKGVLEEDRTKPPKAGEQACLPGI